MLIASGQISEAIPQPAVADTTARSSDRTEGPSAFAEEFGKAFEADDSRPSQGSETAKSDEQKREKSPAQAQATDESDKTDKTGRKTEGRTDRQSKIAEGKGQDRGLRKAIDEGQSRRTAKGVQAGKPTLADSEATIKEKGATGTREPGDLPDPEKLKLAAKETTNQSEEPADTKEDKLRSERESETKIETVKNGENAVVLGNQKDDAVANSKTTAPSGAENPLDIQKTETTTKQAVVEVRDYRDSRAAKEPADANARTADNASENIDTVESRGPDSEQAAEIRYVRFASERPAETTQVRFTRAESAFATYVRENLSTEMVKQTGIILRNNDKGEIRLVLKPEELGRVRMRIQLDENRLSGRILVDSGLAKEAIEQNLEELYKAFRENGYETGGFEVLVGGQGGQNRGADGEPEQLPAKTLNQLDNAVPILEEIDHQTKMINLVI